MKTQAWLLISLPRQLSQMTGSSVGDIPLGDHHLTVTPLPSTCKHILHPSNTYYKYRVLFFICKTQECSTNMICSGID